jgi:hypothetical protein
MASLMANNSNASERRKTRIVILDIVKFSLDGGVAAILR